jgi:hypothetical protein
VGVQPTEMLTHRERWAWAAVWLASAMALAGCGSARPYRRPPRAANQRPAAPAAWSTHYPWPRAERGYDPLASAFPPPAGCARVEAAEGTWGHWLRHLPLRRAGTPVVTGGGWTVISGRSPHLAGVVDLDVRRNQECADIIFRLRAEYLRWAGRDDEIAFSASGGRLAWAEWKRGIRPHPVGNRLRFRRTAAPDASRASFDRYLAAVFRWCGTLTLARDSRRGDPADIQIGDLFVHGGSPGHAVLVVDLARDRAGKQAALLLEGYMPAQSAYLPAPDAETAWFDLDPHLPVDTPRYGAFEWSELRRFRTSAG